MRSWWFNYVTFVHFGSGMFEASTGDSSILLLSTPPQFLSMTLLTGSSVDAVSQLDSFKRSMPD